MRRARLLLLSSFPPTSSKQSIDRKQAQKARTEEQQERINRERRNPSHDFLVRAVKEKFKDAFEGKCVAWELVTNFFTCRRHRLPTSPTRITLSQDSSFSACGYFRGAKRYITLVRMRSFTKENPEIREKSS